MKIVCLIELTACFTERGSDLDAVFSKYTMFRLQDACQARTIGTQKQLTQPLVYRWASILVGNCL